MLARFPMLTRLAVIGLLIASLAACGGSSAVAGTWTLSNVVGGQFSVPTQGRIVLTLTSDGKVSGQGACNSYSGSYTVSGQSIVFGKLVSTQMACAAPLMAIDTAYFAALQTMTGWQVSGSNLTLTGPAGNLSLVYTNNQG